MKRYWAYLKYIIRHKYYVLFAGVMLGKCSLWQLLLHDMSKFRPSEFFPYAKRFYDENGNSRYQESYSGDVAWNYHIKRNKHHWEYWVYPEFMDINDINLTIITIPPEYIDEMIIDLIATGKTITGNWNDAISYFEKNKSKMVMRPSVKSYISEYLQLLEAKGTLEGK